MLHCELLFLVGYFVSFDMFEKLSILKIDNYRTVFSLESTIFDKWSLGF